MNHSIHDVVDMGRTMHKAQQHNNEIALPAGFILLLGIGFDSISQFCEKSYAYALNSNEYLQFIYLIHYYTSVQLFRLIILSFWGSANLLKTFLWVPVSYVTAAFITFTLAFFTFGFIYYVFSALGKYIPVLRFIILLAYLISLGFYIYGAYNSPFLGL